MLENQVFLTLGFERLHDNTAGTKAATTQFTNVNLAATYYPRIDAPNVTIGYARYADDNGLSNLGLDSLSAINDVTNRVFVQSSYGFMLWAKQTASLSFSTSKRTDNSLQRLDVSNSTFALGVETRYDIPLQTAVDFSVNLNTLPTGTGRGQSHDLNYSMLGLRGRYEIIAGLLALSAGVNPTFGDFKRTVIDLGGEYYVMPAMVISLQFSYFNNEGVPEDNYFSLRYRYDI